MAVLSSSAMRQFMVCNGVGTPTSWDAYPSPRIGPNDPISGQRKVSELFVKIYALTLLADYNVRGPVYLHDALLGLRNPLSDVYDPFNTSNPSYNNYGTSFDIQNAPCLAQNPSVGIQDALYSTGNTLVRPQSSIQNLSASSRDTSRPGAYGSSLQSDIHPASPGIYDASLRSSVYDALLRSSIDNALLQSSIDDASLVHDASSVHDTSLFHNTPLRSSAHDASLQSRTHDGSLQSSFYDTSPRSSVHNSSLGSRVHDPSLGSSIHGSSLGSSVHNSSLGNSLHDSSLGSNIHDSSLGSSVHDSSLGNSLHNSSLESSVHDSSLGSGIHDYSQQSGVHDASTGLRNTSMGFQHASLDIQDVSADLQNLFSGFQDVQLNSMTQASSIHSSVPASTSHHQTSVASSHRPSHGLNYFHPYNSITRSSNARALSTSTLIGHPAPLSLPSAIVPVQTPAPLSLLLPRTNQVIVSALPKPTKGPLVTTSALNFEEYCRIHDYKRIPAMFRPKEPGSERSTASTYFLWDNVRNLAQESVGYAGGLGFRKYKIYYDNGEGKVETFESVLTNRLGWNAETFKATTRLFEIAENLTKNCIWDPARIPTASMNHQTGSGKFILGKESPYEVWKGIVYLFFQPGFFMNHYEPLHSADKSEEEQIAAQVSQNVMHSHLNKIQSFLVFRNSLEPLRKC
ncbi:hypothetical protein C8R41DRAFT_926374 [Lentinula lateritia]|uniref:Uncharacterized protein n=1 Tax=Lentinula lateritia TaxID=40482 RepID=A0ABQ8UYB9_9AGAR|nr:hypothetical protein C8R41DRAFT_926374 [Lentinula lateritia]